MFYIWGTQRGRLFLSVEVYPVFSHLQKKRWANFFCIFFDSRGKFKELRQLLVQLIKCSFLSAMSKNKSVFLYPVPGHDFDSFRLRYNVCKIQFRERDFFFSRSNIFFTLYLTDYISTSYHFLLKESIKQIFLK